MKHRTCVVCDREFEGQGNAVCCPPTDRDRAAQKTPRSWCARRRQRHLERGTPLKGQPPQPFTCVQCHADVELTTGHAERRFCSEVCKKEWHHLHVEGRPSRSEVAARRKEAQWQKVVESFIHEPTRYEVAEYRRVLRRDPCSYCGGPSTSVDHIHPTSGGGDDDFTNWTGACLLCNTTKSTLPLLSALTFVPVATEYHRLRRLNFS